MQRTCAALADQQDLRTRSGQMRGGIAFQIASGDAKRTFGLSTRAFVRFAHIDEDGAVRLAPGGAAVIREE